MRKPFIFVSCGQFTSAEKALGVQICRVVEDITGLNAFFAEEVQDLSGLDSNILGALRNCSGLIAVMHPRGEISQPNGSTLVRASVWIEQEIAIATYIQRVEKRQLPVIAFLQESVGREGIRDLVHLNPVPFKEDSEVLRILRDRLREWKKLLAPGLRIELRSVVVAPQDGHVIRRLQVFLANDTNQSIKEFYGKVCLPAGLLKHWNAHYEDEAKSDDPSYRCFRFDERSYGYTPPHETRRLRFFDYCTDCAIKAAGNDSGRVAGAVLDARIWVDGREYGDRKTVEDLASS